MNQHREVQKALGHVRNLVVSIAKRRPQGFTRVAADGATEALRIARVHLEQAEVQIRKVDELFDTYQGEIRTPDEVTA